ncbi:MAG: hypothetical protein CM15mP81_17640 [Alphaproteobacteria bacterium]|nr:MAG: hypothetical protein CM15mP81_17640 [Alphaproteobacteria bacterium]
MINMAIEEPKFDLINKTHSYEIRMYKERLAVQTIKNSGPDRAFMRLFDYISGSNQNSSKIDMTAPVIEYEIDNGKVMNFFLPEIYSKSNAPKPNSENVNLVTIKGGPYAVIKYSGRSSYDNFLKYVKILQVFNKDNVKTIGEPIKATYNGPMTPFFCDEMRLCFELI